MVAAMLTAFWLGILTSISPCPLATNIAAISFISKKIVHTRSVLITGFAYTLGRMIAYTMVGFLIIKSLLSVPTAANFLQKYMNKALGPILILVGLFLLDVFRFSMASITLSEKHQHRLADSGVLGSCALGFLFALAFCPLSAALFFGSLIPLAVASPIGLSLPLIYGIGTALPALLFAVGIAMGAIAVSRWFHKLTKAEPYVRKATGVVFIVVGIYYILSHVFNIL